MSAVATLLPLAAGASTATAEGEGFHAPTLGEFFPPAILFEGTVFEFNRIMLVRVIATLVLVTVFWLAARRAKLVPGRFQGAAEMALDVVRVQISEEVLGKESGRRATPVLTVIFFGVFAMNITGVIPGLNIAGSSVIGIPLLFALIAYVAFIAAGVRSQGVGGYLKASLFPPGVPKVLYIILTPIEFLSTFILRPATLTIRLLANMVAGHLLLVLAFGATHYLFLEASGAMKGLGVITLVGGVAFTFFEIFIAVLQAYVFTLLTAVYIQLSEEAH
ncbi:F0F1 ATP synthase subunit A [Georgenia sp. MJ170]